VHHSQPRKLVDLSLMNHLLPQLNERHLCASAAHYNLFEFHRAVSATITDAPLLACSGRRTKFSGAWRERMRFSRFSRTLRKRPLQHLHSPTAFRYHLVALNDFREKSSSILQAFWHISSAIAVAFRNHRLYEILGAWQWTARGVWQWTARGALSKWER
jgi:hypothetical protein